MTKVLAISDISGVGNISLVANISVLTHLGHKVNPLVTSMFSCTTAFPFFKFQRNDKIGEYALDVEKTDGIHAIFVGFTTDINQLDAVIGVLERSKGQATQTIIDPIMADNGKLYGIFNDQFVAKMKDVVAHADLITPNLTEACLLAGLDFFEISSHKNDQNYLAYIGETFSNFLNITGAKSAVITGIETDEYVANAVFENNTTKFVTNKKLHSFFVGTGDLFASVTAGKILNGDSLYNAVVAASQFVYNGIAATDPTSDPRCGIDFQRILHTLK